jgi:hypothetical protein
LSLVHFYWNEMRFIITQLNWCFWILMVRTLLSWLSFIDQRAHSFIETFSLYPQTQNGTFFVWLRFLWTQVTTTKSRWTYSLKKNLSACLDTRFRVLYVRLLQWNVILLKNNMFGFNGVELIQASKLTFNWS